MGKEKKEKKQNDEKMQELRQKSAEFDGLVTEIISKLDQQIEERNVLNTIRSYRPQRVGKSPAYIKVKAVPVTWEEMDCLEKYLDDKYLDHFTGHYFRIDKCILINKYRIKSEFYSYPDLDFD